MKRKITGLKLAGVFVALLAGLCACASTEVQNTETLLSAAGFRTQTPSTQAQVARQSMAEKEPEDPAIQPGSIISGYPEPGTWPLPKREGETTLQWTAGRNATDQQSSNTIGSAQNLSFAKVVKGDRRLVQPNAAKATIEAACGAG